MNKLFLKVCCWFCRYFISMNVLAHLERVALRVVFSVSLPHIYQAPYFCFRVFSTIFLQMQRQRLVCENLLFFPNLQFYIVATLYRELRSRNSCNGSIWVSHLRLLDHRSTLLYWAPPLRRTLNKYFETQCLKKMIYLTTCNRVNSCCITSTIMDKIFDKIFDKMHSREIAHCSKSSISIFQQFFGSIDKIFISGESVGTRLWFNKLLRLSWYFLFFP